jgi:hypothetical protein
MGQVLGFLKLGAIPFQEPGFVTGHDISHAAKEH